MSLCDEIVSKKRHTKTTEIEIYQEEIFESIDKIQLTLEKEHYFISNSEDSLNGQYCYNQQLAEQISKLTDPFSEEEHQQTILKSKDSGKTKENKEKKEKKENKEENKETGVVSSIYRLPNALLKEIDDIINDIYIRNFRSNTEKKFNIFDTEHQFFIQQYKNQNKSKVKLSPKRHFRSFLLSLIKKNANIPLISCNIYSQDYQITLM